MTRRRPIYLEEFYNFKCTRSRDFLTNTKDSKRMLLLQKMLAICGGLVISNTGRFRTVLASCAVKWHSHWSWALSKTLLKGQSNEIFDLQFYSSLEPVLATDQQVEIFSILAKNLSSYTNFKFKNLAPLGMIPQRVSPPGVSYPGESIKNPPKHDPPGYDTPASQ